MHFARRSNNGSAGEHGPRGVPFFVSEGRTVRRSNDTKPGVRLATAVVVGPGLVDETSSRLPRLRNNKLQSSSLPTATFPSSLPFCYFPPSFFRPLPFSFLPTFASSSSSSSFPPSSSYAPPPRRGFLAAPAAVPGTRRTCRRCESVTQLGDEIQHVERSLAVTVEMRGGGGQGPPRERPVRRGFSDVMLNENTLLASPQFLFSFTDPSAHAPFTRGSPKGNTDGTTGPIRWFIARRTA